MSSEIATAERPAAAFVLPTSESALKRVMRAVHATQLGERAVDRALRPALVAVAYRDLRDGPHDGDLAAHQVVPAAQRPRQRGHRERTHPQGQEFTAIDVHGSLPSAPISQSCEQESQWPPPHPPDDPRRSRPKTTKSMAITRTDTAAIMS